MQCGVKTRYVTGTSNIFAKYSNEIFPIIIFDHIIRIFMKHMALEISFQNKYVY